jgi:hypothetical protein
MNIKYPSCWFVFKQSLRSFGWAKSYYYMAQILIAVLVLWVASLILGVFILGRASQWLVTWYNPGISWLSPEILYGGSFVVVGAVLWALLPVLVLCITYYWDEKISDLVQLRIHSDRSFSKVVRQIWHHFSGMLKITLKVLLYSVLLTLLLVIPVIGNILFLLGVVWVVTYELVHTIGRFYIEDDQLSAFFRTHLRFWLKCGCIATLLSMIPLFGLISPFLNLVLFSVAIQSIVIRNQTL